MISARKKYQGKAEDRASQLLSFSVTHSIEDTLRYALTDLYPDQSCIVSSFGTESAIILHMISKIRLDIPVLFIDTGKLFPETLIYKSELENLLKLTNIQILRADEAQLSEKDPDGNLHKNNPDLCCHIRKTTPLNEALEPYQLWISGRKRYHGNERSNIEFVEIQDNRLKLNPLYNWTIEQLRDYSIQHKLPPHPLVKKGFPSVGCQPCTCPVTASEANPRAGRWAGQEKTECGIHIDPNGKIIRLTQKQ